MVDPDSSCVCVGGLLESNANLQRSFGFSCQVAHKMNDEGARSTTKIFANVFISFIGAGILGVPFAFKEVGINKILRVSSSCGSIGYENRTP